MQQVCTNNDEWLSVLPATVFYSCHTLHPFMLLLLLLLLLILLLFITLLLLLLVLLLVVLLSIIRYFLGD